MKAARTILAVAAGAAITLGAAGAAYADSPAATPTASAGTGATAKAAGGAAARLKVEQALASARIQGRISTLHALSLAAQNSKYLTGDERSALDKQITSDLGGLTSLATQMADATTVAAVRTDETAMVDNYRVYMLMAPQTRLVDAVAAETDAAATLQKAESALQQLLAKQPGGGSTQQKSELADLQSQVTQAQAAIGDDVTTVLAIQPGPDASSIESALAPVKSAVKSARKDLVQARQDAKELRDSLKS
jgi:hypothetical protein